MFLHAGSLLRVQAHHHPNIGRLLQPRCYSRLADTLGAGKRQGLLIHGARCNSGKRARYFASIGCDSFDGTGASTYPKLIPRYLRWAAIPTQRRLFI